MSLSFTAGFRLLYPESADERFVQPAREFLRRWAQGDTHFTLHTSGSTGVPAPVQVSRAQLLASAQGTIRFFGLRPEDRLLCALPLDKVAGQMMLVRALVLDAPLYLLPPSTHPVRDIPADWPETFDFMPLVPLQAARLLEEAPHFFQRIRILLLGGGVSHLALREALLRLKPEGIYQSYGMTETVSHVALAKLSRSPQLRYQALPGVELRQRADGGLSLRGPMTANDWLDTRDLVRLEDDGMHFEWLGRQDHVINSGGLKLYPEVLERALEGRHPLFQGDRYFFHGQEDAAFGQRLILVLEVAVLEVEQARFLKQLCQQVLPGGISPRGVSWTSVFVRTSTNKVKRTQTVALCQHILF
ncbi:MAG: AMP-binding protein [Nitritalea sp.]